MPRGVAAWRRELANRREKEFLLDMVEHWRRAYRESQAVVHQQQVTLRAIQNIASNTLNG